MDNLGFTVAAYVATFTLIGAYTWSLARRVRRAQRGGSWP